ncbi:BspA family leucine-rich repeat surface protein [Companilactobacillus jidongensis]|uniref:BspA family leucine-rich repeat surface protein n=1 Tax=Companilactobacillus jidongensis TaxID=2486006 RepID=UPI000F778E72|nr:BspA family leucine-rich repeat surface protein [Companilactobacillus jidongensis]
MIGSKIKLSERNKQYVLGLIIALSGVLLILGGPQIVKADSTGVETSDLQGMLNENNAVIQNAPSTQSAAVNTIAPLAATTTASGTFGTCDWDIDDTGLLTIHAGVLGAGNTANSNNNYPKADWLPYASKITAVYADPGVVANSISNALFAMLPNVTSIDVSNIDMSNVTSAMYMFYYDEKLTTITGTDKWDVSKVTSMQDMFAVARLISNIDVSTWDVSNVTDMSEMFYVTNTSNLVGLQNWDTSKVTNMYRMFLGSAKSDMSDVSNWNVSNVTNMSYMFAQMYKLKTIDISNWDRSKVTDISGMFYLDSSLVEINGLGNWDTTNVTNMSQTFGGTRFTSMPEVEKWNTENVTNLNGTFSSCTKLQHLDLSGWNTGKVTTMASLLNSDSLLNEDTFKGLDTMDTSNVTDMSSMFSGTGFKILNLSNFKTSKVRSLTSTFANTNNLEEVIDRNFDTSSLTLMNAIFNNSNITDFTGLNIADWDTRKVTSFAQAFKNNKAVNLNFVENWNVSSGTDFSEMFSSCTNLITVPTSSWNMPQASNLNSMFNFDSKLKNLNTSNWAPQKLTNLQNTFQGTALLKYIDVSNWNTSAVTTMDSTFYNCSSLENLDVSNWNTDKVTDMESLFANDYLLSNLNLSNWNTTKADTTKMFNGMSNLWAITLGENSVITEGSGLPTHNPGNSIYDSSIPTQYKSISDRWQEVAPEKGGTPHEPAGELYTQEDLLNLYGTTGSAAQTYVWQQQPYMDVSMDVPDLSYGTASPNQGITPREQSNWAITLNNNVYPVTTLNTTISVNMETPLVNNAGDTLDDSFIFRDGSGKDSVIDTAPTTIYDGKLANGTKSLTWDSKHGFLMDLHSFQTPMGKYSTTLDWTMVNSV